MTSSSDEQQQLSGNDAYKTNFVRVDMAGEAAGNGLKYGTPHLVVKCPRARYYVSGAVYRRGDDGALRVVQVDQSIDDPATEAVENTLRFRLAEPDGRPFRRGTYVLRAVQDGTQKWEDEFIIA